MLGFNKDKLISKYINNLNSNKDKLLQHFMKLYFYKDYSEKDGLRCPSWTLMHWCEEINEIIDTKSPLNKLSLDKIPSSNRKELENAFSPSLTNWGANIQIFIKGNDGYYELPKLEESYINKHKETILRLYRVFTGRIITRLNYKATSILVDNLFLLIMELFRNKSLPEFKLAMKASSISFSEDEASYNRYEYLQNFIFNDNQEY